MADDASLDCLIEALGNFLHRLDRAHDTWIDSESDKAPRDVLHRLATARSEECVAWREIRKQLAPAGPNIIPSPGQSPVEWVTELLNKIDDAHHLVRFLETIKPESPESEAQFQEIQRDLRDRLPLLRNEIWRAHLHLRHTQEARSAIGAENAKPAAGGPAPGDGDSKIATDATAAETGKPAVAEHKPAMPRTGEPVKKAFQAWHVSRALSITNQTDIAAKMTELGVPATQGQVSKWLHAVDEWQKAGGCIPTVEELNARPDAVDPAVLDMGARRDRRTPRQRPRRAPDADSGDE